MDIIKGQRQDLLDIISIISECTELMKSQGIFQWDEYYPTIDIVENDIDDGNCYVMKHNNRSVAYVAINEEEEEGLNRIVSSTNEGKSLAIHRLCVHPNFQGKGIAKTILKFIEEFCNKNAYDFIRLDAYSENKNALKLYENFGYNKVGEVFFPGVELPFYCYEKYI